MTHPRRLIHMTWPEVAAYLERDDRVIVPMGSTEQHGPRAPFGTDHRIAHALALDLSARTGVIAAPALPIGLSTHHMAFPGSLTLSPGTMIALLRDVLSSLHRNGLSGVMLLNGHGGNRGIVSAALSQITDELPGLRAQFVCWWDPEGVHEMIGDLYGEHDGHHATPSETSLMMHYYPQAVRDMDLGPHTAPQRPVFPDPAQFRVLHPDGVVGANPDLASAEHGRLLSEKILSGLETKLEQLAETRPQDSGK